MTEPMEAVDVARDRLVFPCRFCGADIEFLLGDGRVTLVDRDAFTVVHAGCLDLVPPSGLRS